MQPPIVVCNRGDLVVFLSVRRAEQNLEAIDVENDEYVIYDSAGTLIAPHLVDGMLHLRPAEGAPQHAGELRRTIARFIQRAGDGGPEVESLHLSELVQRALRYTVR